MNVHRVQTIGGVLVCLIFLELYMYIPHCQIKTLQIPYDTVYTMYSTLLYKLEHGHEKVTNIVTPTHKVQVDKRMKCVVLFRLTIEQSPCSIE